MSSFIQSLPSIWNLTKTKHKLSTSHALSLSLSLFCPSLPLSQRFQRIKPTSFFPTLTCMDWHSHSLSHMHMQIDLTLSLSSLSPSKTTIVCFGSHSFICKWRSDDDGIDDAMMTNASSHIKTYLTFFIMVFQFFVPTHSKSNSLFLFSIKIISY